MKTKAATPPCTHHQKPGHKGKGPSSYWMQNPDLIFDSLGLFRGDRVLDMGCGAGDYALEAARIVGPSGFVAAVDHWSPIVDAVEEVARAERLTNVKSILGDITRPPLAVDDNDMDMCMIFTVLHIFGLKPHGPGIYREAARVLNPGGCLAGVECKKEKMSLGPPVHMRLAPEEIEASIRGTGFKKAGYTDLGYNYLLRFILA